MFAQGGYRWISARSRHEPANMSPDATGGGRALALIDQVLGKRPDKDDVALAACARELCVYRDALIMNQRAAPSDLGANQRLAHVNAVLATVLAVHFPIDAVPWDELEKAKAWLAEVWAEGTPTVASAPAPSSRLASPKRAATASPQP
jgi:hypothetical protein